MKRTSLLQSMLVLMAAWPGLLVAQSPILNSVSQNYAILGSTPAIRLFGYDLLGSVSTEVCYTGPAGTIFSIPVCRPATGTATVLSAVVPASSVAILGSIFVRQTNAAAQVSSNGLPFYWIPATATPAPVLTSLTRTQAVVGSGDLVVTLNGSGFAPLSAVGHTAYFVQPSGAPLALATQLLGDGAVTATIPATRLNRVGTGYVYLEVATPVGVVNSTSLPFQIVLPSISSVAPAVGLVNSSPAVTLTGQFPDQTAGYNTSRTVVFTKPGGTPVLIPPSSVSATQVVFTIPAAQMDTLGSAGIVFRVVTGEVTWNDSNTASFLVASPPAISILSPSAAVAGAAAFTLTLTGSNLNIGGLPITVQWISGQIVTPLVVTASSATAVSAQVPAALVAAPGTVSVGLSTGGFSSNPMPFTIYPAPVLTGVSPFELFAGASIPTLLLYGSELNTGASPIVRWTPAGGAPRDLTVLSATATMVSAVLPPALIAAAGSASVAIVKGGVASAPRQVTIYPSPVLLSLSPRGVPAGSSGVTLNITGQNFGVVSYYAPVVNFGSTVLYPSSSTASTLLVTVPASLLSTPRTVPVTVEMVGILGVQENLKSTVASASREPAEVGPLSNVLNFEVLGPLTVTTLFPTWIQAGTATTQLIVNGTGFDSGSQILFGGVRLATVFQSAARLTGSIPASLLTVAGDRAVAVQDSFGRTSNNVTLPILPPIQITALSPPVVEAGSASFVLTVDGGGFEPQNVVALDGEPLPTTFVSANRLTVPVSAALVAAIRTFGVSVRDVRGRESSSFPFAVVAPLSLTSVSPVRVNAGVASVALTLNGHGFTPQAVLRFSGVTVPATFHSSSTLTAIVPGSLLTYPGPADVRVAMPDGRVSNAAPFTILPQLIITSLQPAATQAGANSLLLTVNGQGFTNESVVRAEGLGLLTTFVSETQLTALVSDTLLANAGSLSVTVMNPPDAVSNAFLFGIGSGPITITNVTPGGVPLNSPVTAILVSGTGFAPGVVLRFGATEIATQYVSATQLTGTIPAALLTAPGTVPVTATLGSLVSNSFPFRVGDWPEITSLSPNSITAGATSFGLVVLGRGFVSGASIHFGESALATVYTSATQLSAVVPAEWIATPRTVAVTVVNPDGHVSNAVDFRVVSLSLTSMTPDRAVAGSQSFVLNLTGTGFISGVMASFGGTTLQTTYSSATSLSATVPAGLIANPGAVLVTVSNPDGARSNALSFTVESDTPSISRLHPSAVVAGSGEVTVNVIGASFVRGSSVIASGRSLGTTFNSSVSLDAVVPADLTAVIRTLQFRVVNPGNRESNEVAFQVTAPMPAISRISPASVNAATTADLTIAVTGSGFIDGSSVQFNGSGIETAYQSPTSLTAVIPASELAEPGNALVRVVNPGNLVSNVVLFQILSPITIASVSPASIVAGSGRSVEITVTGSGFMNGSTVYCNESALATTWTGGNSLVAVLPPSLMTTAGVCRISVHNPNGAVSNLFSLRIDAPIVAPPLQLVAPAVLTPAGGGRVQVTLERAAPVLLTGALQLSFVNNSSNAPAGYSDPALLFAASGSRTVAFSIPAGSTAGVIGAEGAFSPGTVAGTITVAMTSLTGGGQNLLPDPAPVRTIQVERAAPSIVAGSVRIVAIAGGFQVELTGVSSVRDLRSATFTFTSPVTNILEGSSVTVDVQQLFAAYYSSAAGLPAGGTFRLIMPFTVSGGDPGAVTQVAVTLTNSIGTSSAVTGGR